MNNGLYVCYEENKVCPVREISGADIVRLFNDGMTKDMLIGMVKGYCRTTKQNACSMVEYALYQDAMRKSRESRLSKRVE